MPLTEFTTENTEKNFCSVVFRVSAVNEELHGFLGNQRPWNPTLPIAVMNRFRSHDGRGGSTAAERLPHRTAAAPRQKAQRITRAKNPSLTHSPNHRRICDCNSPGFPFQHRAAEATAYETVRPRRSAERAAWPASLRSSRQTSNSFR